MVGAAIRNIIRKNWPALLLLSLMGGLAALVAYELYGRWQYASYVSRYKGCDDLKTFRLSDGRRLSYRETGHPDGQPAFYFHGAVGSSMEWPVREDHTLRLIGLDRPGYGCSTPQPQRSLEGWARDVAEVAGQLGWKRFSVIGFSAGAPHALAVAAYLPDQVERVVVSGVARSAPFTTVRLLAPGICYQIFSAMRLAWARDPDGFEVQSSRDLPPSDRELYRRPDILARFRATHERALRQSVAGVYEDVRLLGKPLSFQANEIRVPVEIWHGSEDKVAPIASVEELYRTIPGAAFHRIAGEGHFLIYPHEQELLAAVSK